MFNIPSLAAPKALHPTNTQTNKNKKGRSQQTSLTSLFIFFLTLPVCCVICNHVFFMCFHVFWSCEVWNAVMSCENFPFIKCHPKDFWNTHSHSDVDACGLFQVKNLFSRRSAFMLHTSHTYFSAFSQPCSDLYSSVVTASYGTTCWSPYPLMMMQRWALGTRDQHGSPHVHLKTGGINNYMDRHQLQYQVKVPFVVNDSSPEKLT